MVPHFTTRPARWPVLVIAIAAMTIRNGVAQQPDINFFRERIQPVLIEHCYECHSSRAKSLEGSLRLDHREHMLAGGDRGPAVVPGDAKASLLLQSMRYQDLEMPPKGRLPDLVIADFEKWISSGAAVSAEVSASAFPREPNYGEARTFWAFQPVRKQALPSVQDRPWARAGIDRFVLHELERRDLTPADPASPRELVRRIYFDLIGLPPTPEQVDAFVSDASPGAFERLVDRLLTSPHYGERWAQHWLDVVRYAESEGYEYDRRLPGAWRFRDYVIESFNHDKRYDTFVSEQLAGDELDRTDPNLRVAAGFHRFGTVRRNAGNQEVASSRNEVLVERTDIVGSAFLGLTVGCARCHDHKFDPIPQQDYYRLQAFFAATYEDNVVLAGSAQLQRWKETRERIQTQIGELTELLKKQKGKEEEPTRMRIQRLEAQLPPPLPTLCSITNDPQQITPVHLLRRGDPDLPGPRVGMRVLGVLVPDEMQALAPNVTNPRTQLADWLTDPDNPLTARVFVNRIWQQHFGQGIVTTANDFGNNGARPSHAGLLDYLANALIESGWSVKSLQRMIVLSSTYRQASTASQIARATEIDPENRWLWRFPRRRLSAEEIRDAMLAASGQLNNKAGGESVMVPVDEELVSQLYKPSQWQVAEDPAEHHRRSIYLFAKRNLRLPFMEVFDQPTSQTSCPTREQSTHPPQSLELLNGRLSNELAAAFADRLYRQAGADVRSQVDLAYRLATGRSPTAAEQQIATKFVHEVSLLEFALAMFNLNAFLYVN